MTKLVPISICDNETERDAVSAALRIAGIEHAISERAADGKYEVRVRDADSDRADEVVNRIWGVDARAAQAASRADDAPYPEREECESCGSTDIATTPRFAMFFIGSIMAVGMTYVATRAISPLVFFLVAGIAIAVLVTDRRRCRECGYGWK